MKINHTIHSRQRAGQRKISDKAIEIVLQHGRHIDQGDRIRTEMMIKDHSKAVVIWGEGANNDINIITCFVKGKLDLDPK